MSDLGSHDGAEVAARRCGSGSGGIRPGPWFAPLVPAYAAAVLARRWGYDHGVLASHRTAIATIAVGGLEAGGSGKTPVTALLLRALLAAGRRPGLLTRGYGRARHDLVVRLRGDPPLAQAIGDEAAMLVQSGLDIPVAACPSRRQGAAALGSADVDCLMLDDGFQHRALARNLDIVVLRGEHPFGNGHLLPWGTLREPVSSLRRAQVIWLHFRGRAQLVRPAWVDQYAADAELVVSEATPATPRDSQGARVELAGRRVVGAAGIANPGDFFASLAQLGAQVIEAHAFADHHRYRGDDVAALIARAKGCKADAVVVTPKDAVKLVSQWPQGTSLWVLGTQPKILAGAEFLARRLGVPSSVLALADAVTALSV